MGKSSSIVPELKELEKQEVDAFGVPLDTYLYMGADFRHVDRLSGSQALKILVQGAKPETLPVLKQEELMVSYDQEKLGAFGISIPPQAEKLFKPSVFE